MRWLIIVRGDRADLLETLRVRYAGHADVILDRRSGERRRRVVLRPSNGNGTNERRFTDRRLPLSPPEEDMWRHHGYRLVYRSALFSILNRSPEGVPVG